MAKTRTLMKSMTLTTNRRPYLFRKGTRIALCATEADIRRLNDNPGASMDSFRPATSYGMQVGNAVAAAINGWIAEFGPKPDAEDLAIMVSFTSFEIVVEVSDANRLSDVTDQL